MMMMICGWEPGDALSATIGGVSAKLWGVCTNCALFPRALQIKNYYWDTSSSSSPLSLIFRHKIACMHCICILIIMHVYLLLFLLFCFLEFLCFLLSRWWWWWLCDGVNDDDDDDGDDDDADEDDDDDGDVVDTEHLAALATSGPCLSNYSSTFIQRYCEHHQPFFFSTFGFFFVSCHFFAMLRNLLSKQFIWTFNNENSSSSMLAAMVRGNEKGCHKVEDGGNNDNIVEN